MFKRSLLAGAAGLLAGLGAASIANATTWQAFVIEGYTGDVATAAAYVANIATAVHIGDVSNVNFNSEGTDYTIGSFLASGGFTYSGSIAGDSLDQTLWLFYTDSSFASAPTLTVTHDDGIQVVYQNIGGPAYDGFTSSVTAPITETGSCSLCTGPGQVGIVYNETGGPPGVLQVLSVPEPATWALMLVGFGGLGMAMRRSRKASATVA